LATSVSTVPKILQIPPVLYPIVKNLDDYRYFLLEGGRGGGKSQSVGRFILYLADKYNLRVVCGREIQKSINESVYSLMSDLIREHNLYYEIFSTKITHKEKNSVINFRGFREQGAFNIQGMEGIDITWIDEAQAITKQTLDVLIPTIRKENAKVFFTMNRHVVDDPVYETFADRDDCLHIHLNYFDNPFCTEALKKEADECRKKSEADYRHIWQGIPLDRSEDAVFGQEDVERAKEVYRLRQGYGLRIAGFDIARYGDDKCAVVILQQMGALHWSVVHIDQWDKKDLNFTTGRILQITNEHNVDHAIVDEDGLGAGPLDTLTKGRGLNYFKGFRNPVIPYNKDKYYCNPRTANAYKLKDMLLKGHIHFTDKDLCKELTTAFRYEFDNYQRKRLVSKEKMRKEGIASPNIADALIMAVSLIGEIRYDQDNQFVNLPQYSREESLL